MNAAQLILIERKYIKGPDAIMVFVKEGWGGKKVLVCRCDFFNALIELIPWVAS